MGMPCEFSDRKIPNVCRDCLCCHRYLELSDWMPSWLPWDWKCQSQFGDKRHYENGEETCPNKEIKK